MNLDQDRPAPSHHAHPQLETAGIEQPLLDPLEILRRFLDTDRENTQTGQQEDWLPELLGDRRRWAATFPGLRRGRFDRLERLTRLRHDLRALTEHRPGSAQSFGRWLREFPPQMRVEMTEAGLHLRYVAPPGSGAAGALVALAAQIVIDGTADHLLDRPVTVEGHSAESDSPSAI